jgi:hypothetical protein
LHSDYLRIALLSIRADPSPEALKKKYVISQAIQFSNETVSFNRRGRRRIAEENLYSSVLLRRPLRFFDLA